jgi:putative cardiolipin synthase
LTVEINDLMFAAAVMMLATAIAVGVAKKLELGARNDSGIENAYTMVHKTQARRLSRRHGAVVNRALACSAAALASLVVACVGPPSLEGRTETTAFASTDTTRLGQSVAPRVVANSDKSGIYALTLPGDAFAARALLANAAERSLDVQYYIWHADQTGYLLFEAFWQAAERGVRVRLLLDDDNTAGLDEAIAVLDAHANIEVRLYNPLVYRTARGVNFVTDFMRVNRRMHNKSFTADNQVSIVGGRNIGNEYLGAGELAFTDLDVVVIGPAVRDVSCAFDLYWNSPSAYPASRIVAAIEPDAVARLQAHFAAAHTDPESIEFLEAVRKTPLVQKLIARQLSFEWTDVQVLRDDPSKTLEASPREAALLLTELLRSMGHPNETFDIVSPYFVPGEEGTAALVALARRGVRVRVLTNSLGATDVPAVHAGYAKRRRTLLEAGVQLYELKRSAATDNPERKRKFGGSSFSSLHAKTFEVDGKRVFVGSFNFDQRSAHLNTEMGLVISSPTLAQEIATEFDTGIPKAAYEVQVNPNGQLQWIDRTSMGVMSFDHEPGAALVERSWVQFLSGLPIEWLL